MNINRYAPSHQQSSASCVASHANGDLAAATSGVDSSAKNYCSHVWYATFEGAFFCCVKCGDACPNETSCVAVRGSTAEEGVA